MKGIILAGGSGTRLYPITKAISKQINAIYDKPMIYYPLSTLMLANIREILIISTPRDLPVFQELLGDGSHLGMKFSYAVQLEPNGLAEAFIIAHHEKFLLKGERCALILGDNLFYGHGLSGILQMAGTLQEGALIFGYGVSHPQSYGVVEFNEEKKVISLEEKPLVPRSHFAVPGLYFYDDTVVEKALSLKPSSRGELEITDLNRLYLVEEKLRVDLLGRGMAWLDTGTHDDLLDAANFVRTIQHRQGVMVACIEEIAFRNRWMSREALGKTAEELSKTAYGEYLKQLLGGQDGGLL